jgi:predicted enzyme related to lactoylglutathione lyase
MADNPVVWFEIYVKDMARARRFYESVLALKLDKLESPDKSLEMWSFPAEQEGRGASGALARMEGGPSGGNTSTIIYFRCEDCATEESRVEPNGGKVVKRKAPIGQYGFISLVTDTENNMIGLHSRK